MLSMSVQAESCLDNAVAGTHLFNAVAQWLPCMLNLVCQFVPHFDPHNFR